MIRLLSVGSVRPPLDEAVGHYESRLLHYWKFESIEVAAGLGRGGKASASEVRAAEGARLLDQVPHEADVWALTRDGSALSSRALARELEDRRLHSAPPLVLVIGGAFGLDPDVLDRARRRIRLSTMTLPHEMARLVLVEQLYRAGTILRGEPYHKGGAT